jgi:uncharacterized YigZ family protein
LTTPIQKSFYFTVEKPAVAEFKDRGSKFIAYVYPIANADDFKNHLLALKKEHPKAVHHCFAYRFGIDGNNFRVNDDGEPSGSAGRPILGQIDSKELINVAVIVVRYFGGSLLGVPGLINAYKMVTTLALQLTPIIQKQVELVYELHFDYTNINDVLTITKQYNCTILQQELQLFCVIKLGIAINRLDEVLYKLKDIKGTEITRISK